mgnify:CR=1 FL=1
MSFREISSTQRIQYSLRHAQRASQCSLKYLRLRSQQRCQNQFLVGVLRHEHATYATSIIAGRRGFEITQFQSKYGKCLPRCHPPGYLVVASPLNVRAQQCGLQRPSSTKLISLNNHGHHCCTAARRLYTSAPGY